MQGISPFLWFNDQAEQAANFYVSIFKNSRIKNIMRHGEGGPAPKGAVMLVSFELNGQEFLALNGGPTYQFTEAISFVVNCDTQEEIDYYWSKLTEGGKEIQCGWLKDKYGLAWQIVPTAIGRIMSDPARGPRAFAALMQMVKINIKALEEA